MWLLPSSLWGLLQLQGFILDVGPIILFDISKSLFLDEYLKTNQPIKERVYGGQFRVTNGKQVNDPGSIFHMQQTEEFRKKIHYLLNNSPIAKTYKGTEVFLLER